GDSGQRRPRGSVVERAGVELSRSHGRIIERPRLTHLLTESESRVMLLVAPAGYGKTTLAREWLSGSDHAWYQATAASSDIAALALGVASATAAVVPDTGQRLRARLKTSTDPASQAESLAKDLAEDLTSWPRNARLVIDDYHLLAESSAAEKFIQELVGTTSVP